MMSDNDSVSSSSSSDEEIVMVKAVEVEKPARKGRGKAKAKTPDEKVEEVVAAAVAPAPKAKRAKKVKVQEPEIEEIPPHQGGDPVKKTRKSRSKSAEVEPYTQVTTEGMEDFKKKSTRKKKEPAPEPEPVAEELPVSVQRNGRKKREIGPEERERLLANLARGRETRKKNFELKRQEQAKLIEAAKVRIADPVVKEVHHHYKEAPPTPVKKAAPRIAATRPTPMPVFV
tara:strand:- start:98 stop:784 length:687 start_codon:yes stop_codon:yes gene_type:complete